MALNDFGPTVNIAQHAGIPFTASLKQRLVDGGSVNSEFVGSAARDESGRVCVEFSHQPGGGGAIPVVRAIDDPVIGRMVTLDLAKGSAHVLQIGPPGLARRGAAALGISLSRFEEWRTIEGWRCRKLESLLRDGARVETWFCEELLVPLEEVLSGNDRIVVWRLSNIQRVQPDRSLFEIPLGFSISFAEGPVP